MADITVYGTVTCADCRRSKRLLVERGVEFDWVDLDTDPEAVEYVQRLQDGGMRTPTIVFADGSFLAEPTNPELEAKLLALGKLEPA